MNFRLNLLLLLVISLPASAQKIEKLLNSNLEPVARGGRYFSILEKKGDRWHREVYYLPERNLAMEGDFLDEEAKLADGEHRAYGVNRRLRMVEHFSAGKKQGVFLRFGDKGELLDSCQYENDWRQGLGLSWNEDGFLTDSSWFDGAGNGRVVHRYPSGILAATGRMLRDTARAGQWLYYHDNGKLQAEVVFADNRAVNCRNFTPEGTAGDPKLCQEREAGFPGGTKAWGSFLMHRLKAPADAAPGLYTVRCRFIVNTDGSLSDIEIVHSEGPLFDNEVLRLMKDSPRWEPAIQFGRYVKAYRTQPISFMISE